jgi:hypothetical protein
VIAPVPKPLVIRSQEYQEHVRGLPCLICGAPGHPHHVLHRRGYGDARNLAPLCPRHHTGELGIHNLGCETWEKRFRLRLQPIAVLLYESWVKANDVEV